MSAWAAPTAVIGLRLIGSASALAAAQVRRFPSLDVDARGWPEVARRDRVIAEAPSQLPGPRSCDGQQPERLVGWFAGKAYEEAA